jgi:lipooligosaccharide transport system permease protein
VPVRTPGLLLVVEREARVYRRLWHSSVFSAFVLPALFLGAIGLGLGGLVDERAGSVEGLSYVQFVTPGLLAATAMQIAAGGSLWGVLAGIKWIRHYHGVVATPLTPADLFGGYRVFDGLKVAMTSTVFLIVAAALGGVRSPWAVLAVPAAVLTSMAFGVLLTAYAATQETDVTFALIIRLVITPLFLFSGTFFPVSQLPGWLRPASRLSPLWHGVELCRSFTSGHIVWGDAFGHTAVLVSLMFVGWMLGTRSFTRALAR